VHDPRDLPGILRDELEQLRTSGYDVMAVEDEVERAVAKGAPDEALFDRLRHARRRPDWPYDEPSAEPMEDPGGVADTSLDSTDLPDRLRGAWLGRCAGCCLGKPIEGWPARAIRDFLETGANWPPTDYLAAPEPWPDRYPPPKPSWATATRGRIRGMPRDDDIDYTILGLHVLETHGTGFTTEDVADELLDHLPFTQVFTAERVAYRNLVAGVAVGDVATLRNPYREWIGALIRVDAYAYASPGAPGTAAAMALRDARLTHDGNGVYAAMWGAAAIATALGTRSAREVIESGLAQVPPGSRLHEAIGRTLDLYLSGADWSAAYDDLHERLDRYHWVHAINNAAAIAAAVLWGQGDVGRTIGFAVATGWDTDSAGATAGSIAGAMAGAAGIPRRWTDPLDNRIASAISGFDGVAISTLAERTLALATTVRARA
jgi:ADP-ribosylglycohydrolase